MNALKERNSEHTHSHKKRKLNEKQETELLSIFDENYKAPVKEKKKIDLRAIDINKILKVLKYSIIILCAILVLYLLFSFVVSLFNQPSLKVKGDEHIKIEVFSEYKDKGAKAHYFGFNISDKIVTTNPVDTNKVGDYKIEYKITKGKKTKTISRTVSVVDTKNPTLTLTGETELTVSAFHLFNEPGFIATDNYDGNIASKVEIISEEKNGTYTVTYIATDSSGNKSTAKRTVHINDTVSPEIHVNGKETVWVPQGGIYTEHGAWAVDDADGVLTDSVSISGTVNTQVAGDYIITYSIADSSGNTSSTSRTVKIKPMEVIPDKEIVSYDGVSRIYLTFDDGPSSKVTPQILDILKENNVKATFFILDYTEENKAIVKRAIDEGHTIGIHGYSHQWTTYSSDEAYLENIQKLHDKVFNDFGYDAKIIRFLGGSSNTLSINYSLGIMTRLAFKVKQAGYEYFDWNVSNGDADGSNVPVETLVSNVKSQLKENKSNVVLMHDTNAKQTTVDSLTEIINYGKENGFKFEPITEDTYPIHHNIYN